MFGLVRFFSFSDATFRVVLLTDAILVFARADRENDRPGHTEKMSYESIVAADSILGHRSCCGLFRCIWLCRIGSLRVLLSLKL